MTSKIPDWGETVVLLITTHGSIIAEEDGLEVKKFTVPDGITVKRGLVSAPGECNLASDSELTAFAGILSTFINSLKDNNDEIQNKTINLIMNVIRMHYNKLLPNRKQIVADLSKELSKTNTNISKDDTELLAYKGYVRQFDKGFNVNIFEPGDIMSNKLYTRTNDESVGNTLVIKVIKGKNEGEGINLLPYLAEQNTNDKTSVTLEEIVNYFKKEGVEKVIIFDLSCSNMITPSGKEISERAKRANVRSMSEFVSDPNNENKQKYGLKFGGKTKKRRRGKKNKKNKNKTKSRKSRKSRKSIKSRKSRKNKLS
jgi:hypothetical protein